MSLRNALIAVTLLFALAASGNRPAHGVWFNPRGVGVYSGLGWGMGGYGGYGLGWGGYGGTAGGQYLQGMSQVIRAKGEYNEATAKAMISYEEARTKYIDNRKKWTETYFAMREENTARQTAKREQARHSPEAIANAARSGVPRPLTAEALDPITGKITWPDVLLGDEFSRPREHVEQLMELRATTSGGGTSVPLQDAVKEMTGILKGRIQDLPTNDYISARRFLDSLAHTART